MRVSVERLRVWLLIGAGLLVAVIATFLGYAHLRAHRFLRDLPAKLGADITRESNGFTWSQSSKGKTIYTIHAAKMVQRKDGKTTLHDVGIVLYGQKQDRADRIYGSEFEYDQKAGVVRAMGIVHLDLQAPAPTDNRSKAEYAAGRDPAATNSGLGDKHAEDDERLVHVKTSGLVFVQSLGVASTDQPIEFQYRGLTGQARGADYSSDTGVTVLHSEVRVSGLRDGQPMLLTAAQVEMDRNKEQLTLAHARYVSVGDAASGKEGSRTLTAEDAVVHLRGDGSVERLVASNGVGLEQAGGVLRARNADITANAQSRPEMVRLSGGLTYTSNEPLRQVEGKAGQGTARFDTRGRIEKALMTNYAEMHLRERASPDVAWNERTVTGASIDMNFATAAGGRQWLHDGKAMGAARVLLLNRNVKGGRPQATTSDLHGDTLTATMLWDGRTAKLNHISGAGHTMVKRSDTLGAVDTSAGETLDVSFEALASTGESNPGTANSVSRVVQRGAVTLTHLPAPKPDGLAVPVLLRATAGEATYEADGQTLTLSGKTEVTQGESLLRAERVAIRRDTGDAQAEGGVETSYRQSGSNQTIHVLALRAEFTHDAGLATFRGGPGAPARLWQGGSQVEAPTIEFSQTDKTLVATGRSSDPVRTVLVSSTAGPTNAHSSVRSQVMRVQSQTLRYADADRRAQFSGNVVLLDADGSVRAPEVTALLKSADPATGAKGDGRPAGFLGGSVDRVVAYGGVEVSETGRRATGERLLYTANDGLFVMTGTPSKPPVVVDEVQGTITGAALQFHTGDNSVMVLGSSKAGEGRRVRTETQVRQH